MNSGCRNVALIARGPLAMQRCRVARVAVVLPALAAAMIFVVIGGWCRAAAVAGTWGATNAPYLDGIVCSDGATSAPFASWDFGTGSPAFLLAPVTTANGIDSARLPVAANGPQSTAAVYPGLAGFNSATDIATYATLIDQYGRSGATSIAAVAKAIMGRTGASPASCPGVPDGADLVSTAAALAGPYTLRIAPPTSPAEIGRHSTVRVTVLSARGNPVPGRTVSVSGPDVPPTTAVTDQTGVASVAVPIPADPAATSVAITAQASTPVDLVQVSGDRADLGAVYPGPPTSYTAGTTLTIDTSAQPVVEAGAATGAGLAGQEVELYADVTGLRGHTAAVSFLVHGPLPLSDTGSCAADGVPVTAPTAATTSAVDVTGDQRVTAAAWTPRSAGCYGVEADVTTTNANPVAAAKSTPSSRSNVVIVATTAALTPQNHVLAVGAIHANVSLSKAYGQTASVTGFVQGPVAPTNYSCARADFGAARRSRDFTSSAGGDGGVPLTSPAVTQVGCYRVQAAATLALPDQRAVAIPVTPVVVQVIAPRLVTTVPQLWSVSPTPIAAQVDVSGTENQPAHVALQLAYLPAQPSGCASADWSHAASVGPGASIALRSDATGLTAKSAPTKALGCYLPIARLTIDANPAISITAAVSDVNNAISVGVDPNEHHLSSVPRGVVHPLIPGKLLSGLLVVLEVEAVGVAFLITGRLSAAKARKPAVERRRGWRRVLPG